MDKKLLLLFVAFTLLATGDSLRFRLGRYSYIIIFLNFLVKNYLQIVFLFRGFDEQYIFGQS